MRRFFAWKWQIAGMPFSWPKALEACCRMSWVRGKSGHGPTTLLTSRMIASSVGSFQFKSYPAARLDS